MAWRKAAAIRGRSPAVARAVLAMMAAKLMGATVCVSDVAEAKLKLAQKLGADYIIFNDDDSRFKEKADCITGGKENNRHCPTKADSPPGTGVWRCVMRMRTSGWRRR